MPIELTKFERGEPFPGDYHATLTALQDRLLQRGAALLKPGGTLIYCTCSLEPEEGEFAVQRLLDAESGLCRAPIDSLEVAGRGKLITAVGDLRTLPSHWPDRGSLDGFYACRLRRTA